MKVSRNEMTAALMRAYEGAGYAIGDYQDAAELTTWSEMCGLGGFTETTFPPSAPAATGATRLLFEDQGIAVIDAEGAQVCQQGSLALQLAASLAVKYGLATVHLTHCRNAKLILGGLSRIARKGFYLSAYWQQDEVEHGASFEAGEVFPDYWTVQGSETSRSSGLSSVTILCSAKAALLSNAFKQLTVKPEDAQQATSSALLANRYDAALNDGIEVGAAHWDALNQAAWPILVAASQQSHEGAGPG
jgi:hypothetical protein